MEADYSQVRCADRASVRLRLSQQSPWCCSDKCHTATSDAETKPPFTPHLVGERWMVITEAGVLRWTLEMNIALFWCTYMWQLLYNWWGNSTVIKILQPLLELLLSRACTSVWLPFWQYTTNNDNKTTKQTVPLYCSNSWVMTIKLLGETS